MKNITKSLVVLSMVLVLFTLVVGSVDAADLREGVASWKMVPGATKYNIYYKIRGQVTAPYAVQVPADATNYKISYLPPGKKYVYVVSALNNQGAEFWWSAEKRLFVTLMP